MASLTGSITRGQETEALKALQARKIDAEDFAAIGTNNLLANEVAALILKYRLFTPPAEQIQKILEINEAVWKNLAITAEAVAALGDPPNCPPSDDQHLYGICLFYETGDPVKTFQLNWEACIHVHQPEGVLKWDGLVFTPQGVRQRDTAKPRPIGLRWQVCELGRQFQGQSVRKVLPQLDQCQKIGMGQELPLVATLHPKWAKSINGQDIPFVDAPDLEVAPHGRGDFFGAPSLSFLSDIRQVDLHATSVGHRSGRYGSGVLQ